MDLVRDFALLEEYQCHYDPLGVYKSYGFLGKWQVRWHPGVRKHQDTMDSQKVHGRLDSETVQNLEVIGDERR